MKELHTYNEKEILSRLALGDEKVFSFIYNYYWDKLYFLAYKHLKSAEASEEIVQDVFMTLWDKKNSLRIQSLPAYLAAMTRYAVYRYLAMERKKATFSMDSLSKNEKAFSTDEEGSMDNRLLLEIIENLSDRLPEKCRLVFVENKLKDQALKQVAKKFNISIKTAEAHLTKALKMIRDSLSIFF